MTALQLIVLVIVLSACSISAKLSYSKGGARARFEEKFQKTCSKYKFVDKYLENIKNPSKDYLIFVFHEAGQKAHGGLGDRVAGMITAMAYAIRTKRTFLLQGDQAFEDAFRPYFPPDEEGKALSEHFTWKSWDWANWNREYASNMTKLPCINPHKNAHHCSLDLHYHNKFKVIKYYGNRSYLCRWLIKPSLGLRKELVETLGITERSDLYEVAGCMLRLAMWPTDHLWTALDDSLEAQFHQSNPFSSPGGASAANTGDKSIVSTSKQIGFHFRCGDTSFSATKNSAPNPECYFDTTDKVPWKGTAFSDDHSLDSPLDEAKCGQKLLQQASSPTTADGASASVSGNPNNSAPGGVLAYIASDNGDSAVQINSTLAWPFAIKPPEACHMDIQKSTHCTLTTTLHWFMLSLSDVLVMQALIKPPESVYSNSPETAHLKDEEPAPISAFSRYAAIYSLSPEVIRYGRGCHTANTTALSYQTHGNWVCDPKMFY
eukprot:gene22571-25574_t